MSADIVVSTGSDIEVAVGVEGVDVSYETVGTNDAAAALTSANNAAASALSAGAHDASAAAHDTAAAASAAAALTSEGNAATSATSAASHDTSAGTHDTSAAVSAAVALVSQNAAAASATSAATHDTSAATHDSNSATHDTNSATSATNAAASAAAALASQNAAATSATAAASAADTEIAAKAVRFDAAQGLTSGQKTQAQSNIGLVPGVADGDVIVVQTGGKYPALDGSAITGITAAGALLYNASQSLTPAQQLQALTNAGAGGFHCGVLVYVSATQIKFTPNKGEFYRVNGVLYRIPAAGITGANTGIRKDGATGQNLAASTDYYVTVNAAGVLGYWTRGATYSHTFDTTTGNTGTEVLTASGAVQSGETLIGGVITNASSQFGDTSSFRGVASWFNKRPRNVHGATNGAVITASTTTAEIDTTGRATFWIWGGDSFAALLGGFGSNDTAGSFVRGQLALDAGTGSQVLSTLTSMSSAVANARSGLATALSSEPAEGSHTFQIWGSSGVSGNASITAGYETTVFI